jgi:hypothetical protein
MEAGAPFELERASMKDQSLTEAPAAMMVTNEWNLCILLVHTLYIFTTSHA